MTWGGDGWQDIPNAQTWDGWATGREWETVGTSLDLWTGGPTFHVYYDEYPWTTPAWTELTGIKLQGFNTSRSVQSWWQGANAGFATMRFVDDDTVSTRTAGLQNLGCKMRISVDTPAGEADLFTGFLFEKQWENSPQSATLVLSLFDDIGFSGMNAVTEVTSASNANAADLLRTLISTYSNGYANTGDIAGITAGQGLSNFGTYPASNLLDLLTEITKGELGLLWVDGSGVWQFRERNWWYPQPDPAATIGSLERNNVTVVGRSDPNETEILSFPWTYTNWGVDLRPNTYVWTGGFTGGSASAANSNNVTKTGTRKRTDAVHLANLLDASFGVAFVATTDAQLLSTPFTVDVEIAVDGNNDAMRYCGAADIGDFTEVALETLPYYRRSWYTGYVIGVRHSFSPETGWFTGLTVETGLAYNDNPVAEPE